MSEMNVYGAPVAGIGIDTGIDNRQYAIFKLKPELINLSGNGGKYCFWLKSITTSTGIAVAGNYGHSAVHSHTLTPVGVFPRFLIG